MPQDLLFLYLKSVFVGLAIALPVGPVGFFCIHRSMTSGVAVGMACGFGAAVADSFYGAVAAFGLTFVTNFLTGHEHWLKIIGGVFLCWMGWRMIRYQDLPHSLKPKPSANHMVGAFLTTLFLTLTNPMTIVAFAVVFAGLGLGDASGNYLHPAAVVAGVFTGSATWWLGISFGGKFLRERLTRRLPLIKRIAGLGIIGFGVAAIVSYWL